jgi:hypothetical protein
MTQTAPVIDSHGRLCRLKMRRIREFEAAGAGVFDADGTFVFIPRGELHHAAVRSSPTIGRVVSRLVGEFSGSDSGFSTAPYPLPIGGTGEQFPALARPGAGLG